VKCSEERVRKINLQVACEPTTHRLFFFHPVVKCSKVAAKRRISAIKQLFVKTGEE
jgi:hypothetical protein